MADAESRLLVCTAILNVSWQTSSPGEGRYAIHLLWEDCGIACSQMGTHDPRHWRENVFVTTVSFLPADSSLVFITVTFSEALECSHCPARVTFNVTADPAFAAVVHDKLQVPNTIRKSWNDRDNRCDICATHLNQLKQEAIQMVLALEQAAGSEHYDASPGSPPSISTIPALVGSRHMGGLQQPREWAFVPAPYATSTYTGLVNKHSGKPSSLGVSNGAEKKSGSPTHQAKVSLQMATSPNNGNILNSVAIQAHQYLDGTWSLSRTNGVTLYPYQISQLMTETGREGLTESALNRYNADKPVASSVPASQGSCVASETSTGTSVAASFFAR
ncbi:Kinesin-like protein KIF26B [Microtus ochrogaster]|uniref:Kinesin-like protein KIF26B n=1 Tax=Microtus ochrogaster TaxID=79684 RepID=A0A8J6KSI7_MICOH|nr:Kinesin-like protein KIF26B [Microtus ochrogaster]